jgi:hypothetical protein
MIELGRSDVPKFRGSGVRGSEVPKFRSSGVPKFDVPALGVAKFRSSRSSTFRVRDEVRTWSLRTSEPSNPGTFEPRNVEPRNSGTSELRTPEPWNLGTSLAM